MTRSVQLLPSGDPIDHGDAKQRGPVASPLDLPSQASQQLLFDVRQLARHDSVDVCFVGPSGTGKTLYAEETHRCSPRCDGPLVKLNLAAIESGLAGSELIGHVEGAYTGARGRRVGGLLSANGGTLVLDELTKATAHVQHILLHLFDRDPVRQIGSDREVFFDVRFIALTSISLEDAVRRGELIPDLYERLKTFVLEILPVSKRRADVGAVLASAVRRHAPKFSYGLPPALDDELIEELQQWPLTGNHRELDGLARRLLVKADGAPILRRGHLPRITGLPAPSARSNYQRYQDDHARGPRATFASVRDEALHYQVSVPTIHRWRQQQQRECAPSLES